MRNCPIISARGNNGKQDIPSVWEGCAPKGTTCFYILRARGSMLDDDDDISKL